MDNDVQMKLEQMNGGKGEVKVAADRLALPTAVVSATSTEEKTRGKRRRREKERQTTAATSLVTEPTMQVISGQSRGEDDEFHEEMDGGLLLLNVEKKGSFIVVYGL
ncbi:hypothetical protein PVK06_036213 [Gossypium arboreum]|uniref:Uncharacterized protein n=1 Tax=Gossypium arboreum TaxID=29729 RepID=A0ABR0NL61_GOSAR|nr:hypothetical protein PVK06_036213 [Gossypium arboreum]